MAWTLRKEQISPELDNLLSRRIKFNGVTTTVITRYVRWSYNQYRFGGQLSEGFRTLNAKVKPRNYAQLWGGS
jgi:hypothetical protein